MVEPLTQRGVLQAGGLQYVDTQPADEGGGGCYKPEACNTWTRNLLTRGRRKILRLYRLSGITLLSWHHLAA